MPSAAFHDLRGDVARTFHGTPLRAFPTERKRSFLTLELNGVTHRQLLAPQKLRNRYNLCGALFPAGVQTSTTAIHKIALKVLDKRPAVSNNEHRSWANP